MARRIADNGPRISDARTLHDRFEPIIVGFPMAVGHNSCLEILGKLASCWTLRRRCPRLDDTDGVSTGTSG